jgi:hypothetical protein
MGHVLNDLPGLGQCTMLGNFFASSVTIGFSRRNMFHELEAEVKVHYRVHKTRYLDDVGPVQYSPHYYTH